MAGYLAEKLSLVSSTVNAALRSLGLRVRVADDSTTADQLDSPTSTANAQSVGGASPSSPKQPILRDIGDTLDRALQDAATAEPQTRHLLLEAMEDERMECVAPSTHKI
jgi:hypothetical protein